jgi:hypothetical protein
LFYLQQSFSLTKTALKILQKNPPILCRRVIRNNFECHESYASNFF